MRAKPNSPNTGSRATAPEAMDDGDGAAMLVFEFLNELGFRTGELEAADFKPVVVPCLPCCSSSRSCAGPGPKRADPFRNLR